jgi:hypothetical protein
MKRTTIILPMLMPRISDHAAVQLLDILEQLIACVRHHYEPQIHRWHRRQRRAQPSPMGQRMQLFDDEPF